MKQTTRDNVDEKPVSYYSIRLLVFRISEDGSEIDCRRVVFLIYTVNNSSCKQVACDSFRQKLCYCSVN
jgi:hypothetical protein